jgi:phosphoribosylformimino-5-aminoimidazole carboxamide ribotide isomerase
MLLIPAIDLRCGRCVRLREGDFAAATLYSVEPAALLDRYYALGARWLHVVDLDGAKDGVQANTSIIEGLASHPGVCLQVGGGVRSADVIEKLLSAGVARVVIGSVAAQRPHDVTGWLNYFGIDRICVAFDVRIGPDYAPQVHTEGWTRNTVLSLRDAVDAFPVGSLKHVLCTDIGRDGTLRGPNLALYRATLARYPELWWQASGGIRNGTDLTSLSRLGLRAAVSGTALLEERLSSSDTRRFLSDASTPSCAAAGSLT